MSEPPKVRAKSSSGLSPADVMITIADVTSSFSEDLERQVPCIRPERPLQTTNNSDAVKIDKSQYPQYVPLPSAYPQYVPLPSWPPDRMDGDGTRSSSSSPIPSDSVFEAEMWSNPFTTMPRKTSRRVRTRLRKIDSDSETLHLEKELELAHARQDLQRSCSVDALDEIGDDGGRRLRTKRASTELPDKYFSRLNSRRDAVLERELIRKDPMRVLYSPRTVESLVEFLRSRNGRVDVNILDPQGEAPIHRLVKKKRKERVELLIALLTNSNADVNFGTARSMTALHFAVEEGDELCVKTLIAFGANINQRGYNEFTPLDLAIDNGRLPHIEEILINLHARSSALLMTRTSSIKVPRLHSYAEHMGPVSGGIRLKKNDRLEDFIKRFGVHRLHDELEHYVNRRLSLSQSFGNADEAISIAMQQKELAQYNKTLRTSRPEPTTFALEGGSRILFLDGGGIKGLAQIEVLCQLEERTGRSITELFDWIVGTSTGGIIALGLVYAKKSLVELRQLYFKMKNGIFAKARMGFGFNTRELEDLLKETFGTEMTMSDVPYPKVLIAAVNKSTTNLELQFFNNCFGDEYNDSLVWKVARYTSAAPMFFKECDNYVDGGVLANNPCDCGMTTIQNFYRLQGQKLPIAVVVSVGTGVYPAEKLGKVDIFGKHGLKLESLMKRAQNLISLLSNALVESEMVAENSKSRCEEQGIPFYRFSPHLKEVIAAGETDTEKLLDMIIQTKMETEEQGLKKLVDLFLLIAEASKGLSNPQEEEEESPGAYTKEEVDQLL